LPEGPTLVFALFVGLGLAVGTALVHPRAWLLAIAASVLIVGYNAAKRWPLVGNVALGLLMAVVASIGVASASDGRSLAGALFEARGTLGLVAAIAAWYLQANYEKDRPGDRAAGYATLATVTSV